MIGAQEKTRTSTPVRILAPEASASTNSATWALLYFLFCVTVIDYFAKKRSLYILEKECQQIK